MGYYVNENQHDSRKANFLYAVNSLGPSIIKTQYKNEVDEKEEKWYFVTKIVLTYCEIKIVLVIEKNF